MTKRFPMLLLLVVFMTSILVAQNRNVQNERMETPDPQYKVSTGGGSFVPNAPNAPGEEFLVTGYDYMTNNATRDMIGLVDLDADGVLDPIFAAMQRFPDATGDRFIFFGYKAFGIIDKFMAFADSLIGVGWPDIQYCVGGPFDGNALVMAHFGGESWHSVIDLANFTPVVPFPTTTFGGNFPSFAYTPDAIIASNTDLNLYASVDAGVTFDLLFPIGDGDPNFDETASATDSPSEIPVQKSADNMTIQTFGIYSGGVAGSNPDVCYLYGSTDGGATWGGQIIGVGGNTTARGNTSEYGQVVNRDYAPYFINFSQFSLNVDDNGASHVAVNGYGEGPYMGGADTVNTYPMLYWNSNNQEWVAITMESMEAPDDGAGTDLADNRPGNGIGNAYGTISVSDDGQVVFVAWQGPEYTGAIGSSPINLFPGDGGAATAAIFWTDIYYNLSIDGGTTWEGVGILQGDPGVQESYPVLAPRSTFADGMATAHFLYFDDKVPGTSLFATNNDWSNECVWYYQTMTFAVTGVEDEIVVNNFTLEQNYPNPFNPNTSIKYTLAEQSPVSLKVYDVLGNEVATLVNTTQDVGSYNVNFDATNLASGLYVYTIQAGNFTSTKKMMLLK